MLVVVLDVALLSSTSRHYVVAATEVGGGGAGGGGRGHTNTRNSNTSVVGADVDCVTDNLRGLLTIASPHSIPQSLNSDISSTASETASTTTTTTGLTASHPHHKNNNNSLIQNSHVIQQTCDVIATKIADVTSSPSPLSAAAEPQSANVIPRTSNNIQHNGNKGDILSHTDSENYEVYQSKNNRLSSYPETYYKSPLDHPKAAVETESEYSTLNNFAASSGQEGSAPINQIADEWTFVKDYWEFRSPQVIHEQPIDRVENNAIAPNVHIHSKNDPLISQSRIDPNIDDAESENLDTSISSPSRNRPLPSINTLVRSSVETSQYPPSSPQTRDYLTAPNIKDTEIDPSLPYDRELAYTKNEDLSRNVSYDRPIPILPVSKELLSPYSETLCNPPEASVPVDLSALSTAKDHFRDNYRISHQEDSIAYTSYRSPTEFENRPSQYTPDYASNYSISEYSKLSDLKSTLSVDKETNNRSPSSLYPKESGIPKAHFTDLRRSSPELPKRNNSSADFRHHQEQESVPSAFRSIGSPSLSPDPSGDGSSPRPPVSLLRDLLVLGKPGRTSPSPQHEQVSRVLRSFSG